MGHASTPVSQPWTLTQAAERSAKPAPESHGESHSVQGAYTMVTFVPATEQGAEPQGRVGTGWSSAVHCELLT